MRVFNSRVLIAGSESVAIDLFTRESTQHMPGSKTWGGSHGMEDPTVLSVTHIGEEAPARVTFGGESANVQSGKTITMTICVTTAPSFSYRSVGGGDIAVLAVATGRQSSRQVEMSAVANARAQVKG
jgi:hypothetical protein